MATAKVSKRSVDGMEMPAQGQRSWLWDDQIRGFGVVMTSTGRKSYVLQYRVDGKSSPAKRLKIGTHGSPWTPEGARTRALELLRLVEGGVDPANAEADAEKEDLARAADQEHFAFSNFADRFI